MDLKPNYQSINITLLKRTHWTSFQKPQSKASNEIQLKMANSCVPVFLLFLVFLGHVEVSFGDKCSKEEKSRLQEEHKVCTNTVQQRYSILTLDTNDLPNPLAIRWMINMVVELIYTMRKKLPKTFSVLKFWIHLLNFSLKNIRQTVKR